MIFEYLISYETYPVCEIRQVLIELLTKVLEDNLNDFEEVTIVSLIEICHTRPGREFTNDNGDILSNILVGFTLELPEETNSAQTVVEDFSTALTDTAQIIFAMKFEDPLLQIELAQRSAEIFTLEMKLRRVLSFIYLHAYEEGDPYNLLADESVQLLNKEKPDIEHMKSKSENQFFYLTFSQYVFLNQRQEIKLPTLLEILKTTNDFEIFRTEIIRSPIEQEDDAVLLAGLKERMEAVERMRNCVAHNRRPSKRTIENYENAIPLLNQLLDNYLRRLIP